MDILLYAENEQVRLGLTEFLASEGHEVAGHGQLGSAMGHVTEVRPDLVLVTYDGGESSVTTLHNLVKTKRCPMVLIAQERQRVHAIELLEQGAWAYLLEPLNVMELRTQIERVANHTVVSARRFTFDVLASFQDGFLVLSDALKILFANPATGQFIDGAVSELQGRLVSTFGSPGLLDLIESTVREPEQVQQRHVRLGAKSEVVFARVATIHDANSKIVGLTVHLRALDKLSQSLWQQYQDMKGKLFDSFEAHAQKHSSGHSAAQFTRLRSALSALELMREPVVNDPIPVPVSELLEIALNRARLQGNWKQPCTIEMRNAEPRIPCRRSLLGGTLTQLIHACFQAGGESLKLTARQRQRELHIEFVDQGSCVPELNDQTLADSSDPRNHLMALALACFLAKHQGGHIEKHPVEPGLIFRIPLSL